jgi:hypothetical protein
MEEEIFPCPQKIGNATVLQDYSNAEDNKPKHDGVVARFPMNHLAAIRPSQVLLERPIGRHFLISNKCAFADTDDNSTVPLWR